ncbi:MAG: DNA polymerase III subunit gamma/tau [Bacteriovoracia bacterium]
MEYLGLARKWRPQKFEDLIGQEHISRILTNAIRSNRVGHAYLFTGTRGIGKTSTARILAKTLRCSQKPPCSSANTPDCKDCIEVTDGKSVDVLEIDGASNNGVDAIREIRENAKYLPSSGTRKIYIIDEVHMLSTAAFNALLKTLEEPPAHVVFIFATTDVQKVPATVLSRCQRFDFKRVSSADLQKRLQFICEKEKLNISSNALQIIVREAQGSMRDALSLLDQVVSLADDSATEISEQMVVDGLGLIDRATIVDCVASILKRDPLSALKASGKIHLHGFDLKHFTREILTLLRQVMIARLLSDHQMKPEAYLEISESEIEEVKSLISLRSLEDLDMLFRLLTNGLEDISRSPIQKAILDVLIIKMATAQELYSLDVVDLVVPEGIDPAEQKTSVQSEVSNSVKKNFSAPLAKPSSSPVPATNFSPDTDTKVIWQKAVGFIKAQKPLIASILESLGFVSLKNDQNGVLITLSYSNDQSFYRDQLVSKAYQDPIFSLLKSFFGKTTRIEFQEGKAEKPAQSIEEERRKMILESETMLATQNLLGAKLERLEILHQ